MNIKFQVDEKEEYTILSFELEGNLPPSELKEVKPPNLIGAKGVVLSGRGPIWLYCYLTHVYHPTRFVATYDPRVGGAVVAETHCKEYSVGDIIKLDI
ncbi:MAG: CRISPR-associated ring nuclease Crn3/Csx3 [Promethearchaeota archaeon]